MTEYKNTSVVERLQREEGLSRQVAEKHFAAALDFLQVAASAARPITPPRAVDKAWHCFILHTEDYANFCNEHLGKFVHHRPNGGDNLEAYENARELLIEKFGDVDPAIWEPPSIVECSSTCDALT